MGASFRRWWQGSSEQTQPVGGRNAHEGEGERRRQDVPVGGRERERGEGQGVQEGEGMGEGERREEQDVQGEGEGVGEGERREEQDVQGEGEGVGGEEGREEQDVQGEGEGVGGEEGREEQAANGGEGEGVEEREGSVDPQPAGLTEYSLSPEQVSPTIHAQLEFTESYLETAKEHFDKIDQKYQEALDKRTEIDNLLKEFKGKLKLQNIADFPTCFQKLREDVGDFEHLELSSDKPLRIILGEQAGSNDARNAVKIFNTMLQKCREFPREVEDATASIEEDIQAVKSEHLEVEKTRTALVKSKDVLQQIRTFGEEIDKLVKDVKRARSCLSSIRATGLIRVLDS